MRKILITGGAGFIGGSLAKKLTESQDNFVVIVDSLATGDTRKLPVAGPNWKFIKCDVNNYNDISPVICSYKFDYVFHYAAIVGVKRTLENPVSVLNDIQGIKNILDLAKNTGVKRVFYASSSEVYGEPVVMPQEEITTPLNSRLPYAVVKNVGESFCRSYFQEFGLSYTVFRFFNTYGENQSTDFVISRFLEAALGNRNITIYGDGSQSRTFCYIDDNIEVTTKALSENQFSDTTVNIGNEKEYTIKELAELIIRQTNSKSQIVYLPPLKEGDMTRRLPDISRMKKVLNRDLTSLEEGLSRILNHRKSNSFQY